MNLKFKLFLQPAILVCLLFAAHLIAAQDLQTASVLSGPQPLPGIAGDSSPANPSASAATSPAPKDAPAPPVPRLADDPQSTANPSKVNPQPAATVSGTVVDQAGAVAVGAKVQLSRDNNSSPTLEVLSGDNGEFSFSNLPPGPFHLTISATGFDTK